MPIYTAKNIETAVIDILMNNKISYTYDLAANEIGGHIKKYINSLGHDVKILNIFKPSTKNVEKVYNKSIEPKTDIVVKLNNDKKLKLSLKKDNNSLIANFSNGKIFNNFLNSINVTDETINKFNEFSALLTNNNNSDLKRKARFVHQIEKRNISMIEKEKLINIFDNNIVDGSYDKIIKNNQENARDFVLWLLNENVVDGDKIFLEGLTAKINFNNGDCAAEFIISKHGFYTPEQYLIIFKKDKASRGRDVARIKGVTRAGYNSKLTTEKNYLKLIKMDCMFSF